MKNLALNTAMIATNIMPHRWGVRVFADAAGVRLYTVDLLTVDPEFAAELERHRKSWPINRLR